MKYNFKPGKNQTRNRPSTESMSVSKTGRIGISKKFMTEQGIATGSRAKIYWDADSQTIGVVLVANAEDTQIEDTYPINSTMENGGFISASSFFKTFALNPADYVGYYQYDVLHSADAGIGDGDVFAFAVNKA